MCRERRRRRRRRESEKAKKKKRRASPASAFAHEAREWRDTKGGQRAREREREIKGRAALPPRSPASRAWMRSRSRFCECCVAARWPSTSFSTGVSSPLRPLAMSAAALASDTAMASAAEGLEGWGGGESEGECGGDEEGRKKKERERRKKEASEATTQCPMSFRASSDRRPGQSYSSDHTQRNDRAKEERRAAGQEKRQGEERGNRFIHFPFLATLSLSLFLSLSFPQCRTVRPLALRRRSMRSSRCTISSSSSSSSSRRYRPPGPRRSR